MKVSVGDPAPDFTVTSHDGQEIRLSDYRDKKVVVLFFYPKDGSPICTKEACAFRDAFEDFVDAGAVVIGVSGDSAASHREFAAAHRLPFVLVSDDDGSLRRAYGVAKTMGLLPGRVTYVIDQEGILRLAFSSQMSADRHVREAMKVIQELN
jgi:peroxiredoxin Q/BCP